MLADSRVRMSELCGVL